MVKSRTANSIRNIIFALFSNVGIVLIGFIAQKVFLDVLGEQYNGINGLFTSVISFLSVAELGLGTAMIYNLYKPIAEDNKETIKALMHFYKISYRKIALIVLCMGLALIPFLPKIIGEINISLNIYVIYLLFLFDTCVSYLLVYKQSILNGYQQNYIITFSNLIYVFVFNMANIAILYITGNYYWYLVVKIICRFLHNYVLKIIADRMYPFINEKASPLDENIKKDIFTKVKALLVHKIGSIAIISSDNLIISTLIGVTTVGFYQNYRMVITQIQNLFTQMFSSLTSSIGNLIVKSDKEKNYDIYKKLSYFNVWLSIFCSFSLLVCLDPFIRVWIGDKWLLDQTSVFLLVFNFYLLTLRSSTGIFKDASGIYNEDKHVPFIELFVNVTCSLLLHKLIGLSGIFIGTILSNLVIHLYSFPVFVNKRVFNQSYLSYYFQFFVKFLVGLLMLLLATYIKQFIVLESKFMSLFVAMFVSVLIPNLLILVSTFKTREFKFFYNLIISKIKK